MEIEKNAHDLTMLTEVELSKLMRVSLSKIRSDRFKKLGIPVTYYGRSVRYCLADIREYIEKNKM